MDKEQVETYEREKYEKVWTHGAYRANHSKDLFLSCEKLLEASAPESIIEFGTGTGILIEFLLRRGFNAYGMDIAKNSVNEDIMEKYGERFFFQTVWAPFLYHYDLGIACDFMEHIPTDFVDASLRNMFDTATNIIFSTSTQEDLLGHTIIQEPLHLTVRDAEWWLSRIKKACKPNSKFTKLKNDWHSYWLYVEQGSGKKREKKDWKIEALRDPQPFEIRIGKKGGMGKRVDLGVMERDNIIIEPGIYAVEEILRRVEEAKATRKEKNAQKEKGTT